MGVDQAGQQDDIAEVGGRVVGAGKDVGDDSVGDFDDSVMDRRSVACDNQPGGETARFTHAGLPDALADEWPGVSGGVVARPSFTSSASATSAAGTRTGHS